MLFHRREQGSGVSAIHSEQRGGKKSPFQQTLFHRREQGSGLSATKKRILMLLVVAVGFTVMVILQVMTSRTTVRETLKYSHRLLESRENNIQIDPTAPDIPSVMKKIEQLKENSYIVVNKKADGTWTGLVNQTTTTTIETNQPHQEFLTFHRISKTSSTSVMNLIRKDLHSENAFLTKSEYMDHSAGLLECAYASPTNASNSAFHWKKLKGGRTLGCPHTQYTSLMKKLKQSAPFLNEAKAKGPQSFYFHPFTMVRDPFDRLVSLFYYMQWLYPDWSDDKNLFDDNFPGWMRKLHNDPSHEQDVFPYQFETMDDDLDTAINFITGDTPEVLVLTSDCTSTSIRLLAEKKPQFFSVEQIETFLNSSGANANRRDVSKPKANFNKPL